jgi:hypothetical protein
LIRRPGTGRGGDLEREIERFILHLATERSLSDAYPLSVRQTLDALDARAGEKGCRSKTSAIMVDGGLILPRL